MINPADIKRVKVLIPILEKLSVPRNLTRPIESWADGGGKSPSTRTRKK